MGLREFECFGLHTTDAWLNSLFAAAPQLTFLSIRMNISHSAQTNFLNVPKSMR